MQPFAWVCVILLMLTCPICSKSDISDAHGLNVHLKKCRKKVSADIGPLNLNRPAKKLLLVKKHHIEPFYSLHLVLDEDIQISHDF